MAPRLRVLVLGHEATRSGASLQLLHILRAWSGHPEVELEVVLRRGGELEDAYRAIAPTTVLTPHAVVAVRRAVRLLGQRAVARVRPRDRSAADGTDVHGPTRASHWERRLRLLNARLLEPPPWRLRRVVERVRPDVVLANTGTLGDLVPVLGAAPLVVYVHEQDEVLAQVARPRDIQTLVKRALRLVVSSNAVGEDLVGRRHADASSIVVLHPFAPPRAPADRVDARRELLALLGAAADTLVVGACGGLYWAKDPDAFVELAARLSEGSLASRLQFVWLGGEDPERVRLQAAVSARGMSRQVHFLPPRDDPSSFFAALDVFVLVSRSDSFGVAALEAAREGVPVVCFAGAGGLTEFVGDDAGFSVRGHDLAEMSVRVRQLAEDAALRAKLGAVGARRVLQNHTVEAVAETLLAQLREVAGGSGSRQLPG